MNMLKLILCALLLSGCGMATSIQEANSPLGHRKYVHDEVRPIHTLSPADPDDFDDQFYWLDLSFAF